MTYSKIKEPLFFLSLVVVLITLVFPKHDINSKAIIFCGLCWLIYNPISEKWALLKKNIVPFLVMSSIFWLSAIGLAYTENMTFGEKYFSRNLPFLIFPLIFSTIKFNTQILHYLLKYFSFSVILAIIFALSKAFYLKFNNLGDYFHFLKLESLQDKHNTYFALFIVVAIAYFLFNLTKKTWWYFACILFLLGYIYLLSVRISIIALFWVLIWYLITQRKEIPSKVFYGGILGCLLIPIVFYLTPSFQEKFNPISPEGVEISDVNSRKVHWQATLDQIGQHNILFGQGTGDGHLGLYETYQKFGFDTGFHEEYNAHNQYLEIVLYFGIIGLIALLAILAFAFWFNWKRYNYFEIGILVVFAIFMVTESILQRHDGIVLFAFILSLISFKRIENEKA
jgi:O-antigen ligase